MTGARHTRKKQLQTKTLVELKSVFDRVRKAALAIIKENSAKKDRIKKLQAVLRSEFHHPVDPMAAEAYLIVVEKSSTAKRATTRRKKQKGGMAPLDFQTRPGIDGVHGSFPQYLTGGLSFYNTVNQEGMFQGCGKVDTTPVVPVSIGSNQAGGAVSPLTIISDSLTTLTTRPITPTVPASPLQDLQTAWSGQALGASPLANQNPLKYM